MTNLENSYLDDIAAEICSQLKRQNFEHVESIINSLPEGMMLPTITAETKERPMHVAVGCGAGPSIIQGLIHVMDEKAANQPDTQGLTPLHICCQLSSNPQVFHVLLAAWPDSILVESRAFRTPLDDLIVCVGDEDDDIQWDLAEIMTHALDLCPNAIDHVNYRGQTLLHRALQFGTEQVTIQLIPELLLDRKPELAHIMDHDLVTPLHEACKRDDALSIIHRLVSVSSREHLMAKDALGRSVLHYAIHWAAPADTVREILIACCDLLHAQDSEGHTPMDYFVSFYQLDTSWNDTGCADDGVLECFFASGSINDTGQSRNLVLHSALCTRQCPMCLISYLICTLHDQVRKVDEAGNLPLHLAVQLQPEENEHKMYVEVIRSLLREFPQGARETNPDGILPLHSMIQVGYTWKVGIHVLIQAHPAAICSLNLDALAFCAVLSRIDQDSMYRLLRETPFLIKHNGPRLGHIR